VPGTEAATVTSEFVIGSGTADSWAEPPSTFDSDDGTIVFGGANVEHLLRFSNITIAPGSDIITAHLELTITTTGGNAVNITIGAFDNPDSTPPTNYAEFVARASNLTTASVNWNSVPQGSWGDVITSPDISALIQELVDDPDWDYNDSIMIWIGDNNSDIFSNRQVTSGDFTGGEPKPTLVIEYDEVNLPPVAVDDSFQTNSAANFNVMFNDTDPEAGALSLVSVSTPTNGTTQISAGQIIYTPNPGYIGIDTFTYTIADPANNTDTATVTVDVVENPIYYGIDFDINNSAIPNIYWTTVTYQVYIGSSILVDVFLDGLPVAHIYDAISGMVYFSGHGSEARVLVKNPQNAGDFAAGKAALKDGKRFAWTHSMDDNVFLDEQIEILTNFGWTGGVNIIGEIVSDTRQEHWIADKIRIIELLDMGWAIGNHAWGSNCTPPGNDWEGDILDGYNRLKGIILDSNIPTYKLVGFAAPCFVSNYDPFIVAHRANQTTEVQFNQTGGNGLMIINPSATSFSAGSQTAAAVDSDTVRIGRDLGIEVDPQNSVDIIDWMNTNSTTARNFWYNTLTHGNKEADLLQVAQHAYDEYGADGTDVIWVASPDEVYSYLLARDNTVVSNMAATQLSDGSDPIISNIEVSVSATTVDFEWDTTPATSSMIRYGLTSSLGTLTSETDANPRVINHTKQLSSLSACTNYYFQLVGTDEYEATVESTIETFLTGSCPTSTPSQVSVLSTGSQTSNATQSQSPEKPCSAFKPVGVPVLFSVKRNVTTATIYFVPVNDSVSHYLLNFGSTKPDEYAV